MGERLKSKDKKNTLTESAYFFFKKKKNSYFISNILRERLIADVT